MVAGWSRALLPERQEPLARVDPTSSGLAFEPPQELFDLPEDVDEVSYDVSPDGQKFVMVQKDPLEMRALDLVVVPNWTEEMESRLAAAK
jgi:hypothetical protein